ncbi:hypothetical protein PGDDIFCJ_00096 [Thermus phage YS40_Isch]|nr:hypothetical protein PGDDIFCJ_00096 [Thermus phage YS40_Isch]
MLRRPRLHIGDKLTTTFSASEDDFLDARSLPFLSFCRVALSHLTPPYPLYGDTFTIPHISSFVKTYLGGGDFVGGQSM